ncbi:MAG TPA: signal peptidase II, partial [Aggregatilineales bacterium]|nr:signal peptidase II [Aggregatilineales bacterium]
MQNISDKIQVEARSDEHTKSRQTTLFQWVILFGTAGLLLICDQLSKALVVDRLYLYETWVPVEALKSVFDITYTQNTGAAFGVLPSASGLFLLVAIIAGFVIVYYYRQIRGNAWLLRLVMGLQLGGALGNAIDRVTRG